MNILETVRNQAGARLILLFIATLIFGVASNVVALPPIVYVLVSLLAAPAIIGVAAYFWTTAAEWTKLAIGEKYAEAAHARMRDLEQRELRDTLDPIGQEALDEVNASIARREEDRQNSGE